MFACIEAGVSVSRRLCNIVGLMLFLWSSFLHTFHRCLSCVLLLVHWSRQRGCCFHWPIHLAYINHIGFSNNKAASNNVPYSRLGWWYVWHLKAIKAYTWCTLLYMLPFQTVHNNGFSISNLNCKWPLMGQLKTSFHVNALPALQWRICMSVLCWKLNQFWKAIVLKSFKLLLLEQSYSTTECMEIRGHLSSLVHRGWSLPQCRLFRQDWLLMT